jgi:hypothetical protein
MSINSIKSPTRESRASQLLDMETPAREPSAEALNNLGRGI